MQVEYKQHKLWDIIMLFILWYNVCMQYAFWGDQLNLFVSTYCKSQLVIIEDPSHFSHQVWASQVLVSNARARPRKGNDAHVADAKQLSPSSSVSTMNFAVFPAYTRAPFEIKVTEASCLYLSFITCFQKAHCLVYKARVTPSEGKTNTGSPSGRWSGSFTSFYIFLALQLQWKFPEIFWSIWFSKSSESMALTADPILVSLCFKEKEIEFRQKEHLSLYSGHISGKHHTSKKRSPIMQFRHVDCQKLWRNQILGQSPHIITIWTRHHWPK